MKKIINDPQQVVNDMLVGMQVAHPELDCDLALNTVFRRTLDPNKVAVITGGGSGHEPAHGGYVGWGLLDAAVAGNVFASPPADKIYAAMKTISGTRGIIQIVKNYSGDIMNFGLAKELAEMDGIQVEQIVVKDDVATADDDYTSGRRGIAGTVLVHKLIGASAQAGYDLDQVLRVGTKAVAGLRSVGFALSSCSLPAVGHVGFALGENELEFGMGIHGEPGVEHMQLASAKELAEISVTHILADRAYSGRHTAVLINGLGSTPLMEQYIFLGEVASVLEKNNVAVDRWMVGNYLTSFEMNGISTSILELDDELVDLLDKPCSAPAWKATGKIGG